MSSTKKQPSTNNVVNLNTFRNTKRPITPTTFSTNFVDKPVVTGVTKNSFEGLVEGLKHVLEARDGYLASLLAEDAITPTTGASKEVLEASKTLDEEACAFIIHFSGVLTDVILDYKRLKNL